MKKCFLVVILLMAAIIVKSQYHLLYFSDDSIKRLEFDANHLFKQKKYDESIVIYKELAKIDSFRASSMYDIGINYCFADKFDSSFYYLNKSMQYGYDSLEVYQYFLFIYRYRLKDDSAAFKVLNEMIELWPTITELYVRRASFHLKLDRDIEKYRQDMNKAIELGDEEAKGRLERFDAFLKSQKEKNE